MITVNKTEDGHAIVLLKDVTLYYSSLWKPGSYQGQVQDRLNGKFLLSNDDAKSMHDAIIWCAQQESPKIKTLKQIDSRFHRISKKTIGDEERWQFGTSNSQDYPPILVGDEGRPVADPIGSGKDKMFTAGCIVDAKIELNASTMGNGLAIWSNLHAIQWKDKGVRMGNRLSESDILDGFGTVENAAVDSIDSDSAFDDSDVSNETLNTASPFDDGDDFSFD